MSQLDKLREASNKYNLISFDFFDTLFFRTFRNPEDVFATIGARIGDQNFIFRRKQAQVQAFLEMHRQGRAEISITDIYQNLPYSDPDFTLEEDLELDVIVPNKPYIEFYRELITSGKKVAITSDMYLEQNWFRLALEKFDVPEPHFLLVSASENATKRDTGELFNRLIDRSGISPSQILHFGDNQIADVKRPQSKGIDAIHYDYHEDWFKTFQLNWNVDPSDEITYSDIGKNILGPLTHSFNNWISEKVSEDRVDLVLYCSRDGYIPYLAAQNHPQLNSVSKYFLASRTSLALSRSIEKHWNNIRQYCLSSSELVNLSDLFSRVGIEIDTSNVLQGSKYVEDSLLGNFSTEEIENVFDLFSPALQKTVIRNQRGMRQYLANLGFENINRVAFVDIGWTGSTVNYFAEVVEQWFDCEVFGYYMAIIPNSPCSDLVARRRSFLHERSSVDLSLQLYKNRVSVESLFSAPAETVLGYRSSYGILGTPEVLFDSHNSNFDRSNLVISGVKKFQPSSLNEFKFQNFAIHSLLKLIDSRFSHLGSKGTEGQLENFDDWIKVRK